MTNLIIHFSKYAVIVLMILYTLYSFLVFTYESERRQRSLYRKQNTLTLLIHLICFAVLYLENPSREMIYFLRSSGHLLPGGNHSLYDSVSENRACDPESYADAAFHRPDHDHEA